MKPGRVFHGDGNSGKCELPSAAWHWDTLHRAGISYPECRGTFTHTKGSHGPGGFGFPKIPPGWEEEEEEENSRVGAFMAPDCLERIGSKLKESRERWDIGKEFLAGRVGRDWNGFPGEAGD